MNNLIVTVTGPSGSGKTELVRELCENHPFSKLVSVTTRPMRPKEIEGEDYYFISNDDFDMLEKTDGLVQAAAFNGFRYGTTVTELARVAALGRTPIVIVEPGGLPQFRDIAQANGYQLKTVFLTAGFQTLIERYLQRIHGEPDTSRLSYHAKRIVAVKDEVDWGKTWDFSIRLLNDSSDMEDIARIAEIIGELYGSKSGNAAL